MIKILFMIHDLGKGGAEKVLVNLVNHMNRDLFQITVISLFGGGVNERRLASHIIYHSVFPSMIPGNRRWLKLLTPGVLHRLFIKDKYDIEVAYLEGPSARIISGCPYKDTKLVSWIHCTMHSRDDLSRSFRNYREAAHCYNRMDSIVFVSKEVKMAFLDCCTLHSSETKVFYNTNNSNEIIHLGRKIPKDDLFHTNEFNWCVVGKLSPVKNIARAVRVQKKLSDAGLKSHLYILGDGPLRMELEQLCDKYDITDSVCFLGYQTNPYQYMSRCSLYVCSSDSEGFSTAATESLILGVPVVSTRVSGMEELLGKSNEYGMIMDNSDESLFDGIKQLIENPDLYMYYKKQAEIRGSFFRTESTVSAVEAYFRKILKQNR